MYNIYACSKIFYTDKEVINSLKKNKDLIIWKFYDYI
jgi:hypothetical protein